RLWSFGRGLFAGAEDPRATWNRLLLQLATTPEQRRNFQVLLGFLNALHSRNPDLAHRFLDEATENETLAPWYPVLQTAVGIDKQGVDRLMRSLTLAKAPT